jgi:predicted ATPase/DNA-binding XRE family transcriptional regulator
MMVTATDVTFGDLLKQLRKRSGMTQADLAAAVGYSVPFISNLEQSQRLPNVEVIAQQFVPALGLQDEPHLAMRLVALAAAARGERPPAVGLESRTRAVFRPSDAAHTPSGTAQPTELIGRAAEIKSICNRLLGHHGRLLTLIGPPGLGKTRLGLAVADKLQTVFRDGAAFVPLAAIDDPDLVASAIVSALDIVESEARTPATQLIDFLRRKEMLLILDNFEQILPAATLVAELLAACPDLRVLVTSRERLHLRAEQRYRVPALELADAAALFAQRGQAVDPDFALTPANQPVLDEICQRLDCLPLAIELCASWAALLAPQALLVRLRDHRLNLLVDGPRDMPARQRTLRAAIDWSYSLLDEHERILFRSLGVFAGGFAPETFADIGLDARMLHALVAKSLVQVNTHHDGTRRFELLETLREYAWEQLCAHGEAAALQRRHAAAYLRLAEEAAGHLRSADQSVWLDRLALEPANLRTALAASLAAGEIDTAARLGIALWRFWYIRGHYEEGRRWLQTLLEQTTQPEPRAKLLYGQGMLARRQGDIEAAAANLAAALALYRALADTRGVASALRGLGFVYFLKGDESSARVHLEEALVRFRALDDQEGTAVTLDNLGYIRRDWAEGQRLFQESLALRRQSGNLRGAAMSLAGLASAAIETGDYAAAQRYAQEQLQIDETLGNQAGIINALHLLGNAASVEGNYVAAQLLYEQSIRLCQETDDRLLLPHNFHRLGLTLIRLGEYDRVQICFEQALTLYHERDDVNGVAKTLHAFANLAMAQGRAEKAFALMGAASALRDPIQRHRGLSPREVEELDIEAAARQMLGPEVAAKAWSAGQAMTRQEAVTYALTAA